MYICIIYMYHICTAVCSNVARSTDPCGQASSTTPITPPLHLNVSIIYIYIYIYIYMYVCMYIRYMYLNINLIIYQNIYLLFIL